MTKNAIWLGASVLALSIAGCDDGATADPPPTPSMRIIGTTDCGRIFLPTVQPEELRNEQFRVMALTITGSDPSAASGQFASNIAVSIEQNAEGGSGAVAFLSAYNAGRAANLNQIEALEQAGASFERQFVAGIASDQIICVTPGQVRITATVADYQGQRVETRPEQTFVVTCQSPAQYDLVCGDPEQPDMEVDMAVDDMGVDGGDMGMDEVDMADDRPGLWSINFVPPEDIATLKIGIRNSGLGRRDNVELQFVTSELDVPLPNLPVKFLLSNVTQPGVTISAGREQAVWSDPDESESIVLTNGNGLAVIRLIAGGTPGLAVVRAVALRLPTNSAERAQLFADAECQDDGGEGYDCMFEAYCRRTLREQDGAERETLCEADRSSQVVIEGGIPSGRGMHLVCEDSVIPAFTVREDERWLLANEPGTNCSLQVADRVNGRVNEDTQIFFLTEAGTVNQTSPTDEDGRAVTHLRVGLPPPKDVDADDYEIDAGFLDQGYNPRDGLVRIVATTKGEEDFNDTNGDKIYTVGQDILEPGQDLPEPYLDTNDNGRWDADEEFRDANNDGVWTDANGEWDSNTEIWVSTTVLWVGHLFSCVGEDGNLTDNLDCGCEPRREGEGQPPGCRENVGLRLREQGIVRAWCAEDEICVPPPPQGTNCFTVLPEGRVNLELSFFDINGNCLAGRRMGTYGVAAAGMEVVGEGGGDIHKCFTAFEKPLGGRYFTGALQVDPGGQAFSRIDIDLSYLGVIGIQRDHDFSIGICRPQPMMMEMGPGGQ